MKSWRTALLAPLLPVLPALAQLGGTPPAPPTQPESAKVQVPALPPFTVRPGYEVTVAADGVQNARFMEFGDKGVLYISRPMLGDILALSDTDGDGFYESRTTFVSGMPRVHGLCFAHGFLWFSTTNSIHKAKVTAEGKADEDMEIIGKDQLPGEGMHWWRSLLVTEDHIYTSIGDSGNITDEATTERQKIWRFNLNGGEKTLFASGLRNTEKLRLRPGAPKSPVELWGCDHGSDNYGAKYGDQDAQPMTDTFPPDELNKYVEGGFYGHPFLVGNRVPRGEYADRKDLVELASRTKVPEMCFGAHWANNGFCFLDPAINAKTQAFPADHGGDLFIAFHGSWNSTIPVGYQVARVLMDDGHPYGLLTIVKTVDIAADKMHARPVDCVQAPDGSVLFSDDLGGRIYRIRAKK